MGLGFNTKTNRRAEERVERKIERETFEETQIGPDFAVGFINGVTCSPKELPR